MTEVEPHDDAGRDWGGPAEMTAWEALMWRAEGDRRTRSTGALLELLDREPDWQRVVAAHDRVTREIPRLRERVIEPLVPLVNPAWSVDPHFDLDYHVQRVRLPEPGSMRQLLDLAAGVISRPLDPHRPPWEALVISGLEGGGAAYLFKMHHSLTDGMGLIQLFELTHSRTRKPGRHGAEPAPAERDAATPTSRLWDGVRSGVASAPREVLRQSGETLGLLGRTVRDPVGTAGGALRFGASLRRMLRPPSSGRSPVLRDGGFGYRLVTHDVALDDLKAAGKAAGGSVNDAYLAGVLGTFRRYHEHRGIRVDTMPLAMPISLRSSTDTLGGNRWAGVRFEAPVGESDPGTRIELIGDFVRTAREEPAIGFLDYLAPMLSWLPGPAVSEITGGVTAITDVQASNIPGLGHTGYLAGAKVTRMYPMGPRPGVAAMITMMSYDGTCCVGVNVDPAVVGDIEVFEKCLRDGFDEVLALADTR